MEHLSIVTDQDVRLAREFYWYIMNHTTAIVFLYDSTFCKYYIFGFNAGILMQIISELGYQKSYPKSKIDNQFYYAIPRKRFYYLYNRLIDLRKHIVII